MMDDTLDQFYYYEVIDKEWISMKIMIDFLKKKITLKFFFYKFRN